MSKFVWLGDSWTQGHELSAEEQQTLTYPKLVSDAFDVECVNLGETGSSIEYLSYCLQKNKHKISPGDIVFFNLTSKYRFLWIEEDGTPAVTYKLHSRGKPTEYRKIQEFYEKFVLNEQYVDWKTVTQLNFLFLYTQSLGATPLFLNIFNLTDFEDELIIPDKFWLLPQDKCIAQYILALISDRNMVIVNDMPELTNEEWARAKPLIEKYIHPFVVHPNPLGHKTIAENLKNVIAGHQQQFPELYQI